MARQVICTTLIVFLVVLAVPGCTGGITTTTSLSLTTTASSAPTSTTLATQSTSGESSSTGPSPSTTAIAGQTWQEVVSRFTKGVVEANLPGTLPYSMLPGDEVAWLLGKDAPIHATSATGFRLANGDLVILFGGSMLVAPESPDADIEKALSDAQTALQGMAEAKYVVVGKNVEVTVFDLTFGFVLVAEGDSKELWGLAIGAHV
jgi:hypothetical protein